MEWTPLFYSRTQKFDRWGFGIPEDLPEFFGNVFGKIYQQLGHHVTPEEHLQFIFSDGQRIATANLGTPHQFLTHPDEIEQFAKVVDNNGTTQRLVRQVIGFVSQEIPQGNIVTDIPLPDTETLKNIHAELIQPLWNETNPQIISSHFTQSERLQSLQDILPTDLFHKVQEAQQSGNPICLVYDSAKGVWEDHTQQKFFQQAVKAVSSTPEVTGTAAEATAATISSDHAEQARQHTVETGKKFIEHFYADGQLTTTGMVTIGAVALAAVGGAICLWHKQQQKPDSKIDAAVVELDKHRLVTPESQQTV